MEWLAGNPNELASEINPQTNPLITDSSPDYPYLLATYGLDWGAVPRVLAMKPTTWPKAIRISVRVYDPRGALTENAADNGIDFNRPKVNQRPIQYQPIEMVFVHTF